MFNNITNNNLNGNYQYVMEIEDSFAASPMEIDPSEILIQTLEPVQVNPPNKKRKFDDINENVEQIVPKKRMFFTVRNPINAMRDKVNMYIASTVAKVLDPTIQKRLEN